MLEYKYIVLTLLIYMMMPMVVFNNNNSDMYHFTVHELCGENCVPDYEKNENKSPDPYHAIRVERGGGKGARDSYSNTDRMQE